MAELEVALSLIQVVAFFLPAWAVLIQVYSRVISKLDFEEAPRLVPFVAMTIAIAAIVLIQFSLAASEILRAISPILEAAGDSQDLRDALIQLYYGSAGFVSLGMILIVQSLLADVKYSTAVHIFIVSVAYTAGVLSMWQTGPFRESFPNSSFTVVFLIFLADLVYIEWIRDIKWVREFIQSQIRYN